MASSLRSLAMTARPRYGQRTTRPGGTVMSQRTKRSGKSSPKARDVAAGAAAIAAWLVDGARSASLAQDVLTEMCVRLTECGLPLWRVAVYVNTLHPQVMARRFLWRPGKTTDVAEASFDLAAREDFRTSPIAR